LENDTSRPLLWLRSAPQFHNAAWFANCGRLCQRSVFETTATPTAAETNAAIAASVDGAHARAAALRSVAESASVAAKLNNEAFVMMQYFGYLQRTLTTRPN
jgi:hypothetical protein